MRYNEASVAPYTQSIEKLLDQKRTALLKDTRWTPCTKYGVGLCLDGKTIMILLSFCSLRISHSGVFP